jgi:anti-anti-sigma regulatory factor
MQVKIDTREKFHAITILETVLTANMTEGLADCLLPLLQNDVKSVVLILKDTKTIDKAAAEFLVLMQQRFYENNASFVICELQSGPEETLDQLGLLALINSTPTCIEAGDIVLMEEIERELLDEEE